MKPAIILERVADVLESTVEWSGRIGAFLTLGLVLLVAGNVLLRYLFSVGSVASQELEWHLLAVISLLGISYALRHGDHVRVDIVYQFYREKTRVWLEFMVATFVIVPISLLIAYLSLQFVHQAYAVGEISPDPGGLTHRFLLKLVITIGFVLMALQGAAIALRNGIRLVHLRRGG